MTVRLVIDTDPGVDDAHAMMMALAHPGATVEAITTVAGNVSLEHTTRNACTIVEAMGRDVPIYAGCDGAIIRSPHDASYVHGTDGLGDCGLPAPSRQPVEEHAALALIRLANESPGELTLVAIGPLTNVALATRLDPALPQRYKRLVVMGGAIYGTGNMEDAPASEFNAWTDPEAAAIVFEEWPGLTLVSWETTLRHLVSSAEVDALLNLQTPRGEFFRRITTNLIDWIEQRRGQRLLAAPDGLAMAAALEPDIVSRSERHYVQVELAGRHTRGQTVVDWASLTKHEPNVSIALEFNQERFIELFRAGVQEP